LRRRCGWRCNTLPSASMEMDRDLLELLACPECGSANLALLSDPDFIGVACSSCASRYPIRNGIPQMLPAHLAATLDQKNAYKEKLRASIIGHGDLPRPGNPEVDRFMWEHQLYDWAKEVIYSDSGAGEIFSSYAERGARGLCQFLRERVGPVDGKTLLYVGSGNDRLLSLALEQEGAFIVNLDLVYDSLDDLRQAGARNCVCGDARYLPFRAGAIDVVFSKGSVHHCHPIAKPLWSMARVVKQGGHIIVAEPNKYMLLRLPTLLLPPKLTKALGASVKALWPKGKKSGLGYPTPYEQAISAREVMRILSKEGISQLQLATMTHASPWTPAPVARLWERMGRGMPWLFHRFAFEFIVHGRKI